MNKVLTIIIPTYNMENYLHRCLGSLVIKDEELFETLEVLVINDGSKDLSSVIAHEYQEKYTSVFRVIDKDNGNYGSCVNRGLKEAKGKYIKILDSDDLFNENIFPVFLKCLLSSDADLIISDFVQINDKEKVINKISFNLPVNVETNIVSCDVRSFLPIEMHGITYKKSVFNDIDYKQSEGISYTDQEWSLIPFNSVKTMLYFPSVLYLYYIGREGQTVSFNQMRKKFDDFEIVFKRLLLYILMPQKEWFHVYNETRLLSLVNTMYQILFYNINNSSINKAKEIDSYIFHKNRHFYEMMDNIVLNRRFCKVKYLRLFRNNKMYRLRMSLLYYKSLLLIKKTCRL